jgi:hypothetical protein
VLIIRANKHNPSEYPSESRMGVQYTTYLLVKEQQPSIVGLPATSRLDPRLVQESCVLVPLRLCT